jgi:hypothetical protein
MPKGFDLRCAAGKTARVWQQGKGGGLKPDRRSCSFQRKRAKGRTQRPDKALIDRNHGHVNVVVCESDYRALKRGIENLVPGVQ